MKNLTILILDDEQRVRDEIEEFLSENQFAVCKAELPSQAFNIIDKEDIDIAIVDIKLPEMDGIKVLKKIKENHPEIEVIMISGHGDMQTVIEAMRLGASDYFPKPFRLLEINNAIERTKRFIILHKKLKDAESSVSLLSKEIQDNVGHQLLGKSPAIRNIVNLMTKVARTKNTSVLITGESGTGKELIARGIHFAGSRKQNHFHSVNCSAIPETLFESEFFGHKKGSFTGAIEDKPGWFEISNKGSLFLDEISDMPISQQAKLLRVLEDKKVNKVGSRTTIDVDVRVIAASNRDLESMSETDKFRFDLYHRLSSFIIHIPPLRERREDIPILLDFFITDFSDKMALPIKSIDPRIEKQLLRYNFPGNIRELKNIVERALILCEDGELTMEHFILNPKKMSKNEILIQEETSLDLEQTERSLIIKALEKTDHNKAKAATLLKISWQSLDRRMKKFGI